MNNNCRSVFTSLALLTLFVTQFSSGHASLRRQRRGHSTDSAVAAPAPAMFRNGPSHSGIYDGNTSSVFGGVQWRLQTGGAIHSSPTVANGVVYIGSEDGFLYAIDAVSGDVKWKFSAHSPVSSSAAIANSVVYFGARDGRFYSVSAQTGKVLWSVKTGPDVPLGWGHESGDFITSSPTVVGAQILFGSGDGFLYCVQRQMGRVLWRFRTGGRVRSSPAVDGGSVYVGSQDGKVYAVDSKTGLQKWRYETEGAGLNSGQFGYDRRTVQSSPAVADGVIYIGARDGFLYALGTGDGHLLWRFDHKRSWVNSSPAVVGGLVYAGSSDQRFVQGVEAKTGKENWRFKADGFIWSSPAISGSVLYIGDGAGAIYALDRLTGKQLWRYDISEKIHSSPAVANGRLYFGSEDGGVYALNVSPGPEFKRAVFWDATFTKESTVQSSDVVREFFKDRGYEVLDAQALVTFLNARLDDHAPSVVVFAMDRLPDPTVVETSGVTLFRQYLDAGGKAVWPGMPPLLWPFDVKAGGRRLSAINRGATEKLLGVGYQKGNFDLLTATAVGDSAKWGLSGWWLSAWSADRDANITVLASDEQGLAAAWVRRYNSPEGTGFVRIPLTTTPQGAPSNLPSLQIAAEHLPTQPFGGGIGNGGSGKGPGHRGMK